jgi:HK97 gp10 family phage protein
MKVRIISKSSALKRIDKAIEQLDDNIEQEVKASTERILHNIRTNAPVDTGALRDSFRASYEWKGKTYTSMIESYSSYFKYVLYGTGIYEVNGKGRQTPWVYKDRHGNYRFTYGMRPNPFIDKALIDEKRNLRRAVRKAIKKSFK